MKHFWYRRLPLVQLARGYRDGIAEMAKIFGREGSFLIIFLSALLLRFFVVAIVSDFSFGDARTFLIFFLQDFLIFLAALLTIWIVLAGLLRVRPRELFFYMTLAPWLAIVPPVIDLIATGGGGYWSFYLLSSPENLLKQYISLMGHLPQAIVYFGTKITVFIAVVLVAVLIFVKRRNLILTVLSALVVYGIFFFYAALPSFLSYFYLALVEGQSFFQITEGDIAGLFLTPHQIFATSIGGITVALSVKLSFFYGLIIGTLFFVRYVLDGGTLVNLLPLRQKEGCKSFILDSAFILFSFILFTFFALFSKGYDGHVFFSGVYFLLGLGVFTYYIWFLFSFFAQKWPRESMWLHLFLLSLGTVLLGYTIFYLIFTSFLVLYVISFFAKRIYVLFLIQIMASIAALYAFMLFSEDHGIIDFPWLLLLYVVLVTGLFTFYQYIHLLGRSSEGRILFPLVALAMVAASIFFSVHDNFFVYAILILTIPVVTFLHGNLSLRCTSVFTWFFLYLLLTLCGALFGVM